MPRQGNHFPCCKTGLKTSWESCERKLEKQGGKQKRLAPTPNHNQTKPNQSRPDLPLY